MLADFLCEGEIGVPVARIEAVIENAARAAWLIPVSEMEIGVAGLFHLREIGARMRVAGGFHGGVEIDRVFEVLIALVIEQGIEISAAAEPGLAGHQHAGIHVRGGHFRIARMRDQRNARGPESAI